MARKFERLHGMELIQCNALPGLLRGMSHVVVTIMVYFHCKKRIRTRIEIPVLCRIISIGTVRSS